MNTEVKKYSVGEFLDVVTLYQNKFELMHYMLDQMRSELNTLKNAYKIHEGILESSYKCIEVLEQLSHDNLNYVSEEIVKYKTEYNED